MARRRWNNGKGIGPREIIMLIMAAVLIWAIINAMDAAAQAGSGAPPCPRPPVLPANATASQWSTWQGQLGSWMSCVEGGSAAALNQVVSYGAAISRLSNENAELRRLLGAERGAREQLAARVATQEARPQGLSRAQVDEIAWSKAGDRIAAQQAAWASYQDRWLFDLLEWRWRRHACNFRVQSGAPIPCPDRAAP